MRHRITCNPEAHTSPVCVTKFIRASSVLRALATLITCALSPATAQDNQTLQTDPAIIACSIIVLDQLPKAAEYSVVSAAIDNNDVSLLLRSSRGIPTTLSRTCHFKADKADGKFRLVRSRTPEARECTELVDRITLLINAGSLRFAKQQQSALERCQNILKRELKAETGFLSHTLQLLEIPKYPIDPKDTALR